MSESPCDINNYPEYKIRGGDTPTSPLVSVTLIVRLINWFSLGSVT